MGVIEDEYRCVLPFIRKANKYRERWSNQIQNLVRSLFWPFMEAFLLEGLKDILGDED